MSGGGPLSGKVVVVTGSTRGIGRAIAEACAEAGAVVVVNGRGPNVHDVADEMREKGWNVSAEFADVALPGNVQRLFDHTLHRHRRLDVWFNNAGLSGGFRPLQEFTPEDIRDIVDVNVGGVMLCSRVVVPYMREHGGVLVNMCGRGSRGEVAAYGAPYAATKAAIASLTRSVAAENRDCDRISVVGLIPGMVATDFYTDMTVSPSLAEKRDNVFVALDAFGVPLDRVGAFGAKLAGMVPGRGSGRIHTLVGPLRSMRGVLKLMGARLSGKLKPL